jgi:Competence protein CoiA-like family
MDILIPLARKVETNNLVHIDDVIRSAGGTFVCLKCGLPVIPRQGEVNRYHFAHKPGVSCASPGESILHLWVKHILRKRRRIMLPDGRTFACDEVETEWPHEGMRMDVKMTDMGRGRTILVEAVVTHGLGDDKLDRLIKEGFEVLMVDCSYLPVNMEYEELERWLTQCDEDRELYGPVVNRPVFISEPEESSGLAGFGWVLFIVGVVLGIIFGVRWYLRGRRYRFS